MSKGLLSTPPLSLYIHIPWCIKKCPYCDFNSHQSSTDIPENEYITALLADLKQDSHYIQNRPVHSIFFGGGTPSLFSANGFEHLLNEIQKIVPYDKNIEITMEANPGTFEQQKFSEFRSAGINRLSIGIQSFQQNYLTALGRAHNEQEALLAPEIAIKAGFDNFNLDLMYGLPHQTTEKAIKDISLASSFNPTHVSWYQLTIEPNTAFYSSPPVLPVEDNLFHIQENGQAKLTSEGYQQYEISAYSQPHKRSAHNLNYWHFGDYLGVGAGAHGKITLLAENKIIRTRKTRLPKHYLDKSLKFTTETIAITEQELPLEFMMNAMRLTGGTDAATFENRTGLPISKISDQLSRLRQKKLLDSEALQPSSKGKLFLNDLLSAFL